ncbi:MAG: nicotinate (nicotinamide) nucleotide adenylyltransferase [Candidatus Obscuribacterales bacterium]|nr:nicotinate (nicotinamide) nucleotide adenylyltransferase [Candidatus Obscuribacterales bacterium]
MKKYGPIAFFLLALLLWYFVGLYLPLIVSVALFFVWFDPTSPASQVRRVGIYGGKFDPIHIGHLFAAETARVRYGLDLVHFVLSANPPHKKTGFLDARLRMEMLEAAVSPNKYFVACDVEMRRSGPSYTVDTVKEFRRMYGPDVELFLFLGSEYLDPNHEWYLPKWNGADEIFAEATIITFPRDVNDEESRAGLIRQIEGWIELLPQVAPGAKVMLVKDCAIPSISSTQIRDRVRAGESVWYMTPAEVWRVMRDRNHYRNPGEPWPKRPLGTALSQAAKGIGRELKAFWNSIRARCC